MFGAYCSVTDLFTVFEVSALNGSLSVTPCAPVKGSACVEVHGALFVVSSLGVRVRLRVLSVSSPVCERHDVWHDKRWPSLCALHPTPIVAARTQVSVVMVTVVIDKCCIPRRDLREALSSVIWAVSFGPLRLYGHYIFLNFFNVHCYF